ncbi:MAG TPA: helix-turn-helix transcriptional regulator [Allocoleopsis sp.]
MNRGMGKAGRVLKTVLENYGISQGKLAAAMGIGSSNVYRWVNEIRDPNSETVVRIVETLEKINPDAATEFRRLYMGDFGAE